MASLLYRLGRFAFRRHWWVIGAWATILVLVAGSAAAFSGTMTNNFTIPGTETQRVADKLRAELPEASGGSGSIVFTTAGETAFTAEQEAAVAAALTELTALDSVQNAVNPFQTQAELDGAGAKLAEGRQQLEAARARLEEGRAALAAGRAELEASAAQLDASQSRLDAQKSQVEAAQAAGVPVPEQELGALAAGQAQLDAARRQLTAGQAEIEANNTALEQGAAELEQNGQAADLGERQVQASKGVRFVSEDGQVAVAQVQFTGSINALTPEIRQEVQDVANRAEASGLEVFFSKDITEDVSEIFGAAEVIGLAVAAAVLLIMLGTFVAAGLPLLMAVVGVGVGVGGAFALTSVIEMTSISPILALMLGLAVGIDYSLFIVNRHRSQLLSGMPAEESVARATGTSGNAVLFAGLTVVIALAALSVPGLPFLSVLGLVGAATVAVAVVVAITLTPALLAVIGPRLISRRAWARSAAGGNGRARTGRHAAVTAQSRESGWGGLVTRHPVAALLAGVLVLGAVGIPASGLRVALPDGGSEPTESSAYQAYDALGASFGEGYNGPIIVVADLPEGLDADAARGIGYDIADILRGLPDATAALPVSTSADNGLTVLQVIPKDGPASLSTENLVAEIRAEAGSIKDSTGATIGLTGQTAGNVDVSTKLSEALPVYLGIVVGLSLILLLLVFRSVLVPLLATGGFLLSLAAAFGAVVAVYQWGWLGGVFGVENPSAILSFLPIILIGVLFGLAMDYQVFMVSGMRESYMAGEDARSAVRSGFRHAAPVVTAAAIIMTSVFAGFIFSHLTMVRPIGFALAFGVLVDAFLVRMTIIPAAMHLLGNSAWWVPAWLDRILPDVDVEGAKLSEQPATQEPEPELLTVGR